MDFKTLFSILKKHMADGDDVPYFFREIMAMITTVTETRKIVTDNKVRKLLDNHCELYGGSWNVEETQSENKL